MPKAQPQNPTRTYKTRTTGIFKKASCLHEFDERIRIAIVVEKPGSVPLVFTTEEDGTSWPPLLQEYVSLPSFIHYHEPYISRWRIAVRS